MLDEFTLTPTDCENLCRQHAFDVGCCFLSTRRGCLWKSGETAVNADVISNELLGPIKAVTCTFTTPCKFGSLL